MRQRATSRAPGARIPDRRQVQIMQRQRTVRIGRWSRHWLSFVAGDELLRIAGRHDVVKNNPVAFTERVDPLVQGGKVAVIVTAHLAACRRDQQIAAAVTEAVVVPLRQLRFERVEKEIEADLGLTAEHGQLFLHRVVPLGQVAEQMNPCSPVW